MNHKTRRLPNNISPIIRNLAVGLSLLSLVGCANDGSNEGMRRGALGGAAIGLTMGALSGESGWAAAGALAGGVAGAAAGTMQDYDNDRADYRSDSLSGAIASNNSGGDGEAPANWQEIDAFIGNWQVTMWALNPQGERIDATAEARSTLDNTSSVTFHFSDFASKQISGEVSGSMRLSFDKDKGFEMLNQFSTDQEGNRYVGHYDNQASKYIFLYAGSNQDTFSGVQRTDFRLEMQMVGNDVIVIETWAVGSEEKRIQSYRLTRSG